jgi:hypothetical protein
MNIKLPFSPATGSLDFSRRVPKSNARLEIRGAVRYRSAPKRDDAPPSGMGVSPMYCGTPQCSVGIPTEVNKSVAIFFLRQ